MAGKRMIISEKFHLEQVEQDPGHYGDLLQDNEDYALTAEELIDADLEEERIYRKVAVVNTVELAGEGVPGRKGRRKRSGADEAAAPEEAKENSGAEEEGGKITGPEPEAAAEPAATDLTDGIWVLADGVSIGRIRQTDRLHVHNILENYKITGLETDLHGGHYRIVRRKEDELQEEEADARWAAALTLYYKVSGESTQAAREIAAAGQIAALLASSGERTLSGAGNLQRQPGAEAAGAASAADPGTSGSAPAQSVGGEDSSEERWGIDTSYDTIRKEKDPAGRGMFFLLIAAVYATFYLCFSVPGWIPSLSSGAPAINLFGLHVAGIPGYVPGAVMIAGLLCNILAMFSGGGVLPGAAALLYLASGFIAPTCLLFTAVPAVLCVLGALCKKKGNKALRLILALAGAGVAAFLLYQHFSGNTYFEPFIGKDLTDWNSLTAFARGEPVEYMGPSAINGTGTDPDGDAVYMEYETDADGAVYYEDGVYYEDESDWYEDEEGWYEDETGWYEDESDWWEYETEYLILDETESETLAEEPVPGLPLPAGPGLTLPLPAGPEQTFSAGNDGSAGLN